MGLHMAIQMANPPVAKIPPGLYNEQRADCKGKKLKAGSKAGSVGEQDLTEGIQIGRTLSTGL